MTECLWCSRKNWNSCTKPPWQLLCVWIFQSSAPCVVVWLPFLKLILFEQGCGVYFSRRKCCMTHFPLSSLQVTASCPAVCECPEEPLVCPPGVSTVPDGCGCCKVCAVQLNQDCSPMRPCDHHKGLECNYGNDVTVAWGICRGERGGEQCAFMSAQVVLMYMNMVTVLMRAKGSWYLRNNVQKMSKKLMLIDLPLYKREAVY